MQRAACMQRVAALQRCLGEELAVHARVEPADRPGYDNHRQIARDAKQAWSRSVNYN